MENRKSDTLKEWSDKNECNILWNARYQLIFPIIFVIITILMVLYVFPFFIELMPSKLIINQILLLTIFIIPTIWSMLHWFGSFTQIISVLFLNRAIYNVRKKIKEMTKVRTGKKNSYTLQDGINGVRINLTEYINSSEI